MIAKPKLLKLILIGVGLMLVITAGVSPVAAQIGREVAITGEGDINPGDVIARSRLTGRFSLAATPGTAEIFGVIATDPALAFRDRDGEGVIVVQTGRVPVNVTTVNGDITAGDYLTTSPIAGYGQLADPEHGYILGVALESFNAEAADTTVEGPDGEAVPAGQVSIDLEIRPQQAEPPPVEEPEEDQLTGVGGALEHYLAMITRYIMAAVVALGSIYLAFRFFQNNVQGGLPALGRNPLAQKPIRQMLLLHVFVTVLISAGGLGLSILILILPLFFV